MQECIQGDKKKNYKELYSIIRRGDPHTHGNATVERYEEGGELRVEGMKMKSKLVSSKGDHKTTERQRI